MKRHRTYNDVPIGIPLCLSMSCQNGKLQLFEARTRILKLRVALSHALASSWATFLGNSHIMVGRQTKGGHGYKVVVEDVTRSVSQGTAPGKCTLATHEIASLCKAFKGWILILSTMIGERAAELWIATNRVPSKIMCKTTVVTELTHLNGTYTKPSSRPKAALAFTDNA